MRKKKIQTCHDCKIRVCEKKAMISFLRVNPAWSNELPVHAGRKRSQRRTRGPAVMCLLQYNKQLTDGAQSPDHLTEAMAVIRFKRSATARVVGVGVRFSLSMHKVLTSNPWYLHMLYDFISGMKLQLFFFYDIHLILEIIWPNWIYLYATFYQNYL